MAEKARNLTVELTKSALHALDEIWDWNADHYGYGRGSYFSDSRGVVAGLKYGKHCKRNFGVRSWHLQPGGDGLFVLINFIGVAAL